VDQQEARRRLEELQSDLDRTLATLEAEDAGATTELSHVDNHPADTSGELQEGDRQVAVMENAASQREQVLAALARLDDGTYGRCVDCGQELDEARLDARPEAARCLADQQRWESERV